MKQGRFQGTLRILIAFCCLLMIGWMTLGNATVFVEPFGKHLQGEMSFSDMTAKIAAGYYTDSLTNKYDFVNLNGLFARMSGKRALNEILLLKNGMLTLDNDSYAVDMTFGADNLAAFSDYLAEQDIHLIYSLLVLKSALAQELQPGGKDSTPSRQNGDNLTRMLAERNVDYVDVRRLVADTPEQVNRYYYRTDHHWNPEGALLAFGAILEKMKEIDPSIDITCADPDRWERHSKPDWFLGSHGKRVGTLFAGTDDLIWYTPKFETEISCINHKYRTIRKGDFAAANLREEYIERRDFFHDNPYCVYIGGDYPLVQHRNADAPNRRRVLLIKDSFTLPLQAFFSTAFTEVDVIDPRSYVTSTIAEYCAWTKPDFVLFNTLTSQLRTAPYYQLGIKKARETQLDARWTVVPTDTEVLLAARDNIYNLYELVHSLEAGRTYRISFEDIEVTEGDAQAVSVLVYDWTAKGIVRETLYDAGYCHQYGGSAWTFTVPEEADHRYSLLLYAGLYANAANNAVRYSGITVEMMQ